MAPLILLAATNNLSDVSLVAPYKELRESFKARELVNPEFDFIKEDFDHYQKLKEDITKVVWKNDKKIKKIMT